MPLCYLVPYRNMRKLYQTTYLSCRQYRPWPQEAGAPRLDPATSHSWKHRAGLGLQEADNPTELFEEYLGIPSEIQYCNTKC